MEIEKQRIVEEVLAGVWRDEARKIYLETGQNGLVGLRSGLSFSQEPKATEEGCRPRVRDLIRLKVVLFLDVWEKLATERNDEEVLRFVTEKRSKGTE